MALGKPKSDALTNFLQASLPKGISVENFYTGLSVILVLASFLIVMNMMGKRNNKNLVRIKAIHERRKELASGLLATKKRKKPEGSINFMRKVSNKFELVKKLELEQSETMLIQAGFRSKDAVSIFAFVTLVLPIILGAMGLVAMRVSTVPDMTLNAKLISYLWPVLGLYLGLKLPWMFLKKARAKRYLAIQRGLSDTLDLMTVCAEAGLSVPASMDRVSRELGMAYPEMAEELSFTSIEISFYPDRNKAMLNFADRCDLKEIRGIVTVLIQTEKFGTPVAQALRVLSNEFRQARMMRAENKAARLPALMTLPMILFILPTVFIIIMTPAVINAKKNFAAQDSGGR